MKTRSAADVNKKSFWKTTIGVITAVAALIAAIAALIVALLPIFNGKDKKNEKILPPEKNFIVLLDGKLGSGLDMGVNSAKGNTAWANLNGNELCMSYPGNQDWGAVFITVGKPSNPPRPSKNYSNYNKLLLELRGDKGDESILIGIKDNDDPDDGSESHVRLSLTKNWAEYQISLSQFKTTDLERLYVVTEFTFETTGQRICARKIQFLH
ncbi:MAG: hypothetical protein ACHQFX_19235 [Chitinophagales bacterium]